MKTQVIDLKMLTQTSGEEYEYIKSSILGFKEKNPNINIELEQVNGNYEVEMAIKESNSIDIIHMSESTFIPYLEQNIVQDLMPFIRNDAEIDYDDFYGGALVGPSSDGKLAAIPVDTAVALVYCRKEAFKEAGLDLPKIGWNFEEFSKLALALSNDNKSKKQWGLRLDPDIEKWEAFVKRGGGSYLSPDGKHASGYLDNEKTLNIITDILNWYRENSFIAKPDEGPEFPFDKSYAMVIELSAWIPYLLDEHPDEYLALPLPLNSDGQDTNLLYMGGYGISNSSRHPQVAWNLLKHMAIKEVCDSPRSMPVLKSVAKRLDRLNTPLWNVALNEFNKATQCAFYVNRRWNASRQKINYDLRKWINDTTVNISEGMKNWVQHIDNDSN
ncbi:MAG: ABC transporter substrate-binding protein [Bacillota bacterium]